jgi:preprotein translocase subunit SecD
MVIRLVQFNLKLLLIVSLVSLIGCRTPEKKAEKVQALLRIHMETNPYPPDQSDKIKVLRSMPMTINVEKSPFLNESHIIAAQVLHTGDGFLVMVKFNQQGQWLLEQYTASNQKRRLAIRSQFRVSTNVYDRWIAAPVITKPIKDGVLSFTPDADRTESKAMVQGWNNVSGYEDTESKFDSKFSEVP